MRNGLLIFFTVFSLFLSKAQEFPIFGEEIDVTINGLTFDAMEPFISDDSQTLFFNNLNDGVDTKLFYATKVNDSVFNFVGEIDGTNQSIQPYLDGVADMDSLNNFYWTSTRDYPAHLNNLYRGKYSLGSVTDTSRVFGDFNTNIPGWLVMDHGISIDGEYLYYCNARFDEQNCTGACETNMGVAKKVNDSTFNKIPNSNEVMQTINNPNYIFYAPCLSSDHLEMYFTRYSSGLITPLTTFQICIAVRDSPVENFSEPEVLFQDLIGNLIEAITITSDKNIIYYHRKTSSSHKIVMRYKVGVSNLPEYHDWRGEIRIYPNPMISQTTVDFNDESISMLNLFDNTGRLVKSISVSNLDDYKFSRDNLNSGIYLIEIVNSDNESMIKKMVVY
jgi:hypothetical protein